MSDKNMEHKDICFEIENDEFYRRCRENGNLSVSEKISRLNAGIERLNGELEAQVLSKHADLLTQANHATELERVIGSMQVDARALTAAVERLRSHALVPYELLGDRTLLLTRVQAACHLMRQAAKVLHAYAAIANFDDNPSLRAAQIYDVERIVAGGRFDGVDLLADEIAHVRRLKAEIVADATRKLHEGLSAEDKAALFSSIDIFNRLRCVRQKIADVVDAELQTVTRHVQNACAVDPKPPTFRTHFWDNVQRLFADRLYRSCKKIILLQSALNDLHSFENFRFVAKGFWNEMCDMLAAELKKSSAAVNQCVEIDYPKLLVCHNELCNRLNYKQFTVRRETLSTWENAFMSKSLARMLEPVRAMWQTQHVPDQERVDEAVRVMSTALSVSLGDRHLSVAVAGSVAKCIKQMGAEAEQRVCVDRDAGQVIEPPTVSQQRNVDLSNILFYFSKKINRVILNMLTTLSVESVNIIQLSLKDISAIPFLQPFTLSVNSAVELILASMHAEIESNRSADPSQTVTSSSLYMRELLQFLTRCKDSYISTYEDPLVVKRCCDDIVNHCVKIFIYNICSLGRLSDYWRRKIQLDCSQLVAIFIKLESLSSLPVQYARLRALFNYLKSTPAEIAEKQTRARPLPHSLTMMYLFVYAGPDLLAPHQCAKWSHAEFVRWLCQHESERDRIELVAGALRRYADHVNRKKITQYDDVYPTLMQLLDDARKLSS